MVRTKLGAEQLAEEIGALTKHAFADHGRLLQALTHASARRGAGADYERLEFLGDRVLGLVVADMLFHQYPQADQGELSLRLNALVSAETCAVVAEEIGLHRFIHTGTEIKSLSGQKRINMRADVMESVIAAIYLDGGLDAVRPFIKTHWQARASASGAARRDAKTELQEWAHRQSLAAPTYEIEGRTGPDHDPVFTVVVMVAGCESETGTGTSKRQAEQTAASAFLVREGVWSAEEAGR